MLLKMSMQKDLFVRLAKLQVFKGNGEYEYFRTTGNNTFKCVFLQKLFYFRILLFIFILLLFYNILFFVLPDCKYEYSCTTGNKTYKCVFLLKKIFYFRILLFIFILLLFYNISFFILPDSRKCRYFSSRITRIPP